MFHKSPRCTLTLGRHGFGFPLWETEHVPHVAALGTAERSSPL